jgi:uncharacterized protein (DUF2236 family)
MADDLGYFGPNSVTWRVLADPAAGVGGIRALFLQALYPRAMAAVAEHSQFAQDFWARLQRTAQYVTTVTFGTRAGRRRCRTGACGARTHPRRGSGQWGALRGIR